MVIKYRYTEENGGLTFKSFAKIVPAPYHHQVTKQDTHGTARIDKADLGESPNTDMAMELTSYQAYQTAENNTHTQPTQIFSHALDYSVLD